MALAQDLIRRPSVTPADAGALDVLQTRLIAAGFRVQRLPFSEAGTPDIDNLYARIGDSAPFLLFAGHTDVVPPGDAAKWTKNPFAGEILGGELYGRGAADMKGGIAAFAAADLCVSAPEHGAPKKGSIGFLITGDEEGPAINGTVKMLQWLAEKGEKFDHCVVGEPTNAQDLGDMIKIGRRGSLNGRLTGQGPPGPCRLSPARRQSGSASAGSVRGAEAGRARPRLRLVRRLQSRNHLDRHRQSGDQCHSGRGAGAIQHPLQRPVDAGDAEGRDSPSARIRPSA